MTQRLVVFKYVLDLMVQTVISQSSFWMCVWISFLAYISFVMREYRKKYLWIPGCHVTCFSKSGHYTEIDTLPRAIAAL